MSFHPTSFHYNFDNYRNLTLIYTNQPMVKLIALYTNSQNLSMTLSEDSLYTKSDP